VKTTKAQREMLRADAAEELAGYTSPLTATVRKYPEATLALLDDLDEVRECLRLMYEDTTRFDDDNDRALQARIAAALKEPTP
jgi:hypothetical protein